MSLPARVFLPFALLVVASCAPQQPFSSVDRNKYKSVALNPEMKVPDHYVYHDITGKRSRGMIGGLLGAAIGATSEVQGLGRFKNVASKTPVDIRALVRDRKSTRLNSS